MTRQIFIRLLRNRISLSCLIILALLYLCAIFAPFLSPYPPSTQNLKKAFHPPTAVVFKDWKLQVKVYENIDPSAAQYQAIEGETIPIKFFTGGKLFGLDTEDDQARIYLLGSDSTGRDVFTRLLHGARVSLTIGLVGISITMTLGFVVGALSGYLGGKFDSVMMRYVDFLLAIPTLYLLLALRAAIAPYFPSDKMFYVIIIALAFITWSSSARVIRGMTLSIRQRQFVLAAENMGQGKFAILFKHILPNVSSYLLVAATLSIPNYILGEAALSFLGLGIQEPEASWGLMLSQAKSMKVFMLNFWWLLTPGFLIFITVIAFNILGDVLRDIVDPKMKTTS